MSISVVLRDFDGTETIYPVESLAEKIIHTGDEDSGLLITRHYIQSDQVDPEGRVVYLQSNL
jgi:hypothetical protein